MSYANVTLVKSLYDAFQRGQIDAIVAALATDVDWQTVGSSKDYPTFGPRKGKSAVQEFFHLVGEHEEFSEFRPQEFFSDADRVFVLGTYAGNIKKTGQPFSSEWVHVFTLKDDKVTRFRELTDTAQFAQGFRT